MLHTCPALFIIVSKTLVFTLIGLEKTLEVSSRDKTEPVLPLSLSGIQVFALV